MPKASTKKWFHSKTIWYNALLVVFAGLIAVGAVTQEALDGFVVEAVAAATAAAPLVNLLLRIFFTNTGIEPSVK